MPPVDPLTTINTRVTPQNQPADPTQTLSVSGGYTFVTDDLTRFRRFLATGTEGGTYYASQADHTAENAEVLLRLARTRGPEMLDVVRTASLGGFTVKQHPLMLSLAALVALSDDDTRKAALDSIPDVCRTASHLFLFAKYLRQFRGWGRGIRRGVAAWYTTKDPDALAYQVAKYPSREGYTHDDLLRLAHPNERPRARALQAAETLTVEEQTERDEIIGRDRIYDHITGRPVATDTLPGALRVKAALHSAADVAAVLDIIRAERHVSWEMVPSEHLTHPGVWAALLDHNHVPLGALIRNLPRLTNLGIIDPLGVDDRTSRIIGRLIDPTALAKARVHPMTMLLAAATYRTGRSARGDSTWQPIAAVNKALDLGFKAAFGTIVPDEERRVVIGLDVSGSMDMGSIAGLPGLTPRDAGAALAQILAAQFPRNMGLAFTGGARTGAYSQWDRNWGDTVTPLDVDPGRRVVDLVAETKALDFGRTDCALPVLHALERNLRVDTFLIVTDNETWAGDIHPHQALRQYRERTGIPARMVTVAMQANDRTIADPADPLMLDVVGLDTSSVNVVADFAAGRI